jgi:hypothetical protein
MGLILDRTVIPALGHRPVAGITTWDDEQFIEAMTSEKSLPGPAKA